MTTTNPWIQARIHQILELRRRFNASGQDGSDVVNIAAALAAQHPDIGTQQELFT